jgi:hypothetical protein
VQPMQQQQHHHPAGFLAPQPSAAAGCVPGASLPPPPAASDRGMPRPPAGQPGDASPAAAAASAPSHLFLSDLHMVRDGAKISSVYFDNADLDIYHERLVRQDGATLVRIRRGRAGRMQGAMGLPWDAPYPHCCYCCSMRALMHAYQQMAQMRTTAGGPCATACRGANMSLGAS